MNKGELRAHFKALLNRTDCSDALADTFINQSISRIERTLRIPPMEKTNTYNIAGATTFLMVPSDFLEILDLYSDDNNLQRQPLAKMVEMEKGGENGTPRFFCREGEKFRIYPYPTTGSVVLNYYASFPAMTADSDSIDLGLVASDLITYGALSYASDYFLDERGQLFEAKYQSFIMELQEQSNDAETSGTVQTMQPVAVYEE